MWSSKWEQLISPHSVILFAMPCISLFSLGNSIALCLHVRYPSNVMNNLRGHFINHELGIPCHMLCRFYCVLNNIYYAILRVLWVFRLNVGLNHCVPHDSIWYNLMHVYYSWILLTMHYIVYYRIYVTYIRHWAISPMINIQRYQIIQPNIMVNQMLCQA